MKSYEELGTMAIMSFMDVYVHVSALVIYFIDQMKFLFQLLILISTSVHVGPKEMYEIYFCEF